jgi:exonuclease SbcD
MARLRERFPHTLALAFEPERTGEDPLASYAQRLRGRTDQQIAEDFVTHVRGAAPDPGERQVLREAIDAVRAADVRAEAN